MSEWISVEDELPKVEQEVLCMIASGPSIKPTAYLLCELKSPVNTFYESWGNEPISEFNWHVTHWQKLPEPPE